MLEFRLLGTLEAGEKDAAQLGSRKERALLAYLILHRNEAVPRAALIDALWPDDPPATAAHALDVYVSRLRKSLGVDGLLEARGGALQLNVPEDAVDAARFERLVADARRTTAPVERLAALDEALSLWRGSALADLRDEPFVRPERDRLEEERLAALEERFDTMLTLGRHDEAVGPLQAFVSEQPLRERSRRMLMLALYRAGRQSDALDVYRDFRRLLRDELGLDPSVELRQLEAAILRQDSALSAPPPTAAAPARVASAPTWRRRRRALIAVSAAVAVAAGIILAVLIVTRPGGGQGIVSVPHLSAAAIDPAAGRVTTVLPLRGQPIAALGDGDTVWIANSTDRTLTRIDDRTGAQVATLGLPAEPVALALGAGRLWIASPDREHSLTAVDPRSGDIVLSIPLHQPGLGRFGVGRWTGASDVAFADGSLWTPVGVSGLLRVSPGGRVLRSLVVGPEPNAVAADAHGVWVAILGPAQVVEVDPVTNMLERHVSVADMAPGSEVRTALHCTIAVDGRSLWVPAYNVPLGSGGVWRVDVDKGLVSAVIHTGGSPCTVAIGFGKVWVANPNAQEVDEIDPVDDAIVRRIPLGSPPNAITVARGHVWVTTN
jgi:DNA-binding SARP family transcriptional activator/DNA-binding beta-propeller fold protein YncE